MDKARSDVLVVGAGVCGLTTGIRLLEAGLAVQIWTAAYPASTTSAAAGAYWSPFLVGPSPRLRAWAAGGYRVLTELAADPRTGIRTGTCRRASRGNVVLPWWSDIPADLGDCSPTELPAGFRTGLRYTVPIIDMPVYLEYLLDRFLESGGRLRLHPIRELAEAAGAAEVVVNCAGLGARGLALDPGVRPVRGQTVVVANPGLDGVFVDDSPGSDLSTYIVAHRDVVVLGGTSQEGDSRLDPDPATARSILERCRAVEPLLGGAQVLEHRVGLRPARREVRLEAGGLLEGVRVLHNYGHGGAGVTLSWACADDVTALISTGA
jgi:D-amino-acid oxidase